MTEIELFKSIPVQKIKIRNVSFALRQIGEGEDLIFVHGFPTHGYTWRKILPNLSKFYRCSILDLPGLGESEWSWNTNFNIDSQASFIIELLEKLRISKYNIIAHDSGGAISRVIAIKQPKRVKNLVLINTEIPNHRPPFIELYQKIGLLPFVPFYFRKKLRQIRFVKSSMGFKEAYSDKSMLIEDENLGPYLNPLINSHRRTKGAFKYLKGIDWRIIDEFEKSHGKIESNVLFIWGEDDKTFPIKIARNMINQFNCNLEFKAILKSSLLPHEERPEIVGNEILIFLKKYAT